MHIAPLPPQTEETTEPEVTWNECVINAEDCRIKAQQNPTQSAVLLAQAKYWDLMASKHW
jgi:hypothetical protein